MSGHDPVDLLFGGMEKLGPGSDADTRQVLRGLPAKAFGVVVDAGCGAGRQTMVLAKELRSDIHAVDAHQPFLDELGRRAAQSGVGDLIHVHCMDMTDIPREFPQIDLLWSEGAAYNIGFANALRIWSHAIRPGGFVVVSELAWLRDRVADAEREFFSAAYPDMRQARQNLSLAESAGYDVLDTHTLPREAWIEGYYDVLETRANALADHPDDSVRAFARGRLEEIEVFRSSDGSFGYVFYVLRRA